MVFILLKIAGTGSDHWQLHVKDLLLFSILKFYFPSVCQIEHVLFFATYTVADVYYTRIYE